MVFILGPDVNPRQVPSHISGGLVRVTRVTNFFILQICKNNIILVKKIQWVLRRVLKKIKKNFKKNLDPHSFDQGFYILDVNFFFINLVICCHYLFLSIIRLVKIIKLC